MERRQLPQPNPQAIFPHALPTSRSDAVAGTEDTHYNTPMIPEAPTAAPAAQCSQLYHSVFTTAPHMAPLSTDHDDCLEFGHITAPPHFRHFLPSMPQGGSEGSLGPYNQSGYSPSSTGWSASIQQPPLEHRSAVTDSLQRQPPSCPLPNTAISYHPSAHEFLRHDPVWSLSLQFVPHRSSSTSSFLPFSPPPTLIIGLVPPMNHLDERSRSIYHRPPSPYSRDCSPSQNGDWEVPLGADYCTPAYPDPPPSYLESTGDWSEVVPH